VLIDWASDVSLIGVILAGTRYLGLLPVADTMSEDRIRAHVFVSGNVQGVRYRASTREAAKDRRVAGWVRNLDDGRVEAIFEGPEGAVEEMIEWCHTGSSMASVDDVDVSYEEPTGESGFRVRW
jgi:acylphosphatase